MQTQEVAVAPSLRVILKSDSEILDEVSEIRNFGFEPLSELL